MPGHSLFEKVENYILPHRLVMYGLGSYTFEEIFGGEYSLLKLGIVFLWTVGSSATICNLVVFP
jgi:hypothetical protein